MITVNQILKTYDSVTALDIEHLEIPRGESFGLVGNNGAGKTTLFRLLLDLILPDRGEVLINNSNVVLNEDWKAFTSSYLDENFLIDFLVPEEYFQFLGKLYGMSEGDIQLFYSEFEDFFNGEILGKNKLIRELSKGNQKKVGIAGALMTKPELLILDEPFANLDPSTLIRLKKTLKEYREQNNVTMLISSHDLNHVTEVCERIVVLEKSKIIYDLQTNDSTLKELEDYFGN